MDHQIKQGRPAIKERYVRTPPRFLVHREPRSPEYVKKCSGYVLLVETDGFGVVSPRKVVALI